MDRGSWIEDRGSLIGIGYCVGGLWIEELPAEMCSMRTHSHRAGAAVILSIGILGACAPAANRSSGVDRTLITSEDIEKNPNVPIETLIQRKVTGVVVTRATDGSMHCRPGRSDDQWRGDCSALRSERPAVQYCPRRRADRINPRDILSIKVLKGGDVLYGMRGANSVIVINTK